MVFDSSCHPPCFLPSSISFVTSSLLSLSSSYVHLRTIKFTDCPSFIPLYIYEFPFSFLEFINLTLFPVFFIFFSRSMSWLGKDLDDPEITVRFQRFLFSLFQMVQSGRTADPRGPLLRGNNEDGREDYSDIMPRLRMRGVLPPIRHTLSLRNA
jgi:hypothetical protein